LVPKSNPIFPTLNKPLQNKNEEEEFKIIVNNLSPFTQEKDDTMDQPKSKNDEKKKDKSVVDYSFHEGNNLYTVEEIETIKFKIKERNQKLMNKNNMENVTKTLKKINLNEDILDIENIYCYYKEYVNQSDRTNQEQIIFTLQDES